MCQGQQARQRSIGSLAADNVPGRLRRSSSNVRSMETASVDQVASIWLLAAAIDRLTFRVSHPPGGGGVVVIDSLLSQATPEHRAKRLP
jgi:hypothetical protein